MKNFFQKAAIAALAFSLAAGATSCEKEIDKNVLPDHTELYKSILENFVDRTILPTYKALAEAALDMRKANEALEANPSDATMKDAADAWMVAREWWELSEAFLFGPVGEQALDIDGHIDDWPLELNEIQKEIENGGENIDGKTAWRKEGDVIGFHVTEYLLYRDGNARPFADLTEGEFRYLVAATDALVWDCILAYVAWMGEDNVSDQMQKVFRENQDVVDHLHDNPEWMNFAAKLKSATGYKSWADAVDEIVAGVVEITDEVGNTKIESPYSTGKVEDVESWYSWHSLDDYQNNIHSVKNAYLGGTNDSSRTSVSLSTYVKQVDPELDTRIRTLIDDCIDKIKKMGDGGYSFYEVVLNQINKEQVEAAVEACDELSEVFSSITDLLE